MNVVISIKSHDSLVGGGGGYRAVDNKLLKQVNHFKYLGNLNSPGEERILKLRD